MISENLARAMKEENQQPEGWWYLSFADEERNLGAAIVRGRGLFTALLTAKSHGIDPGGEVLSFPLDLGEPPEPKYRNRLLGFEELQEAFAESGGVASLYTQSED